MQEKLFNLGLALVSFVSLSTAIRVDWNTNKGPIVPAVPTIIPVPQPPYRQPAPVWEDLSNDIPNPNPYQYVLPPPSRPKLPQNNFYRPTVYPQAVNNLYYNSIVPSLGIQYIPNVGNRYSFVLPTRATTTTARAYLPKSDKLNGKYNPKLKKYKAYDTKYNGKYLTQQKQAYYYNPVQQLPYRQAPKSFKPLPSPNSPNTARTTFVRSTKAAAAAWSSNLSPNAIVNFSKRS